MATGVGFGQTRTSQVIEGGQDCVCGHGYLRIDGTKAARGHRIAVCSNNCGAVKCVHCGRDAIDQGNGTYACATRHDVK